jgi:hypothetical protein
VFLVNFVRNVIAGETLSAEVILQPNPSTTIHSARLSLQTHLLKTPVAPSFKSTGIAIAATQEPPANSGPDANKWNAPSTTVQHLPHHQHHEHGHGNSVGSLISSMAALTFIPPAAKILKLAVPGNLPPSIETSKFSFFYTLRLTVSSSSATSNTPRDSLIMDVPVKIIAVGNPIDRFAIPTLARTDSVERWDSLDIKGTNSQGVPIFEGVLEEDAVMYTALYPFQASQWDEVSLKPGDKIKIVDVYVDGWGKGVNLSNGKSGMMPLHGLSEDLNLKLAKATPISPPLTPPLPAATHANAYNPTLFAPPPGPPPPLSPQVSGATLGSNLNLNMGRSLSNISMTYLPPTEPPPAFTPQDSLPVYQPSIAPIVVTDDKRQLAAVSEASRNSKNTSTSAKPKSGGFLGNSETVNAHPVAATPPIHPLTIDSVVNIRIAEAHLGLLHRFSIMESKDQLTDWKFLCRAEQRYMKWWDLLRTYQPNPEEIPLPPLDVALLWHAHMLNPLKYYEDCYHLFAGSGASFGAECPYYMPLERMHAIPGTEYLPIDGSIHSWESYTGESYTLDINNNDAPFKFHCPWCNTVSNVEGQYYVMYRMKDAGIQCCGCQQILTCDNVSARRFIQALMPAGDLVLVGSTLDEKTGVVDTTKAIADNEILFGIRPFFVEVARRNFSTATCSWNIVDEGMKAHLASLRSNRKLTGVRKSTLRNIIRSHRMIPVPLSLDIIAAVIRQRGFTGKMVGGVVDWLERDALPRATVRYHKFLLLMGKEPKKFLVPTLDIDLMWHTHQLYPLRYQLYGLNLDRVNRIINHDDSVEKKTLNDSFAFTSKVWKRHYNERYAIQTVESRSWFGGGGESRRSSKSLFPPYALFAKSKAVTIEKPTGAGQMGGCRIHDASLEPQDRRSSTAFPIGGKTRGKANGSCSSYYPYYYVGGCYSWYACGGGFYHQHRGYGYGGCGGCGSWTLGCGTIGGCGTFTCGGSACGTSACGTSACGTTSACGGSGGCGGGCGGGGCGVST